MKIDSEKIKELRVSHGLTLKDVAARLDSSEATISRYESGQIQKVSPKVILGYSKLFNVPITDIYENAQTEWVSALQEAGLRDPRVAGFIEYLEEQAQKESTEEIQLSDQEIQLILAYREADTRTKQIVDFTLLSPINGKNLTLEVNLPFHEIKPSDQKKE